MNLSSVSDWLAWVSIVIPLAALAWSAVFYTLVRRREVHHQEYERLFQIMDHLGQKGGSIASKMAAAYEMRKYPQYSDLIIRLCEQVEVEGPSANMLKNELKLTADHMRKNGSNA